MRGDVVVETTEQHFILRQGASARSINISDNVAASFSVEIPDSIFRVFQFECDDDGDRMNQCQIRWDEPDQEVSIFTQILHVSTLWVLSLDYPTFFKEFRAWHEAMIKKYKEKTK